MNQEFLHKNFRIVDNRLVRISHKNRTDLNGVASSIPNCDGYYAITIKRKKYKEHNLIWLYHHGEIPAGMTVDHKDRNPLNNDKENLRLATPSQSSCNRKLQKNNTTGYKGVVLLKNGKFRACIQVNKKKIELGEYPTALEAAHAYDKRAIEIHGEFHGQLNFVN